jgi:hypothetical protein
MGQLDGFLESESVVEPEQGQQPESMGVEAESPSAQEPAQQPEQTRTAEQHEQNSAFVPVKAVLEERRKRQELEQELARYRQGTEAAPQGRQVEQPSQGMDQQTTMNMVMNMAESFMRTQHTDYDGARDFFLQQAQQNPYLVWQMRQAPNPAQFAYETGKKLQALQDLGDPNAYREKVKAEIMAELQGNQQVQAQQKAIASASDSLASARAVGAASAPDWAGPASLDDILASKKRR